MESRDLPHKLAPDAEFRGIGGEVPGDQDGARVDAYLAKHFPFLSRAGWQIRIGDGRLLVNGAKVKASSRVRAGDLLTHYMPTGAEPEVDRGIRVLWERKGLIAVYKPGNLPMHESGLYRKNTFTELVKEKVGKEWAAVHRIDRETSGIVICGSDNDLRGRLSIDFAERRVYKEYLAIGRGVSAADSWTSEGAIGDLKASLIRIKRGVVPDGLPAKTEFKVLGRGRDATLLHCRPLTGRTNQIRIHAAHAGHVLFGDKLYHDDEQIFLDYLDHGQTDDITRRTGFRRLCLHAAAIEFKHPADGEFCRIETPLPEDLQDFWADLSTADAAPASSLTQLDAGL